MSQTRPRGEQLRFESDKTGSHVLDTYLEDAELGDRELADLLSDIWDVDGNVESSSFQLRVEDTTQRLQVRMGQFTDPEEAWQYVDNGYILRYRGTHADATAYEATDIVYYSNQLYICHTAHTSTSAVPDGTKFDASLTGSAGALMVANNLSDLGSAATARANLGLEIGTDVQAHDAVLDATTASFTIAEETKLSGIETSATADQTGAEIKSAYEAEADTNAFTDALLSKLNAIEAAADVTDTANVDAAGATMDTDLISASAGAGDSGKPIKLDAGGHIDASMINDADINLDSVTEGSTNKFFTATNQTKLNGIEAAADVTDATNVDAAGATMNTDADVSSNSWVLDENDMASDSNTKLPTQQSVKAYVDNRTKTVIIPVFSHDEAWTAGDGAEYFVVPEDLNGANIVSAHAHAFTPSTSGTPTIQLHHVTKAADILSTALTIDANEKDSKDAVTPAVINTANDDVATGDEIRIDIDVTGTGTLGCHLRLEFELP